jgi:hypothetical protein
MDDSAPADGLTPGDAVLDRGEPVIVDFGLARKESGAPPDRHGRQRRALTPRSVFCNHGPPPAQPIE